MKRPPSLPSLTPGAQMHQTLFYENAIQKSKSNVRKTYGNDWTLRNEAMGHVDIAGSAVTEAGRLSPWDFGLLL